MRWYLLPVLGWCAIIATPAIAANATIEPFTAYYGDSTDLKIVGSKVDSPVQVPHHIGCPQATGVPVDAALQKICAPGKAYYNSIGQSGGGQCGFNVFSGVCVK